MEKCPICNSNGLMLFSSFECENIECKNFVPQNKELYKSEISENYWVSEPVFVGKYPNRNNDIFEDKIRRGLGVPKEFLFNTFAIIDNLHSFHPIGKHIETITFGPPKIGEIDIFIKTNNYIRGKYYDHEMEEIFLFGLDKIKPLGIKIYLSINKGK